MEYMICRCCDGLYLSIRLSFRENVVVARKKIIPRENMINRNNAGVRIIARKKKT